MIMSKGDLNTLVGEVTIKIKDVRKVDEDLTKFY